MNESIIPSFLKIFVYCVLYKIRFYISRICHGAPPFKRLYYWLKLFLILNEYRYPCQQGKSDSAAESGLLQKFEICPIDRTVPNIGS